MTFNDKIAQVIIMQNKKIKNLEKQRDDLAKELAEMKSVKNDLVKEMAKIRKGQKL